MKKILVFVLVTMMILSSMVFSASAAADVWDGTIATAFESGTGTEADPYVIKTGAQLAYLAQEVKAKNSFADKHFVLAGDIDLDGKEWTPIGIYLGSSSEANSTFQGSFDGKGYTVSGISIVSEANSLYNGLFGHVESTGYFKNLVIADSDINANSTSKGRYSGAVAGCLEAAEISSLVAKEDVTITCTGSTGGIAGRIYSPNASYIVNYATVIGTHDDSSSFTGGITGVLGAGSNLSYAANYGTVKGASAFIGGITGITGADGGNGNISNCVNYANLSYDGVSGRYIGGIAGAMGYTKDLSYTNENCYNFGTVSKNPENTKDVKMGEIVGQLRNGTVAVSSCYSVDLEGLESAGATAAACTATLTDVTVKTEAELKALSDVIDAKIAENIVAPEANQPGDGGEGTTTPPTDPTPSVPTGDTAIIFAFAGVAALAAAAFVFAKKRIHE